MRWSERVCVAAATAAAAAGAAAVSAATASSAPACPPADSALSLLSEGDVGDLLTSWNLGHAFRQEFADQHVDGFKLQYLTKDTLDPADFPNAKPLDFAALWGRMQACGLTGNGATPAARVGDNSRRLASKLANEASGNASSGLRIKSNSSAISLGPNGDVHLKRSGDNELTMDNYLRFCDDDSGLIFCNEEGEDVTVTTDRQGNLYVKGTVHFTGNVSIAGLHIDEYVAKRFDELVEMRGAANIGKRSCQEILAANSTAVDGVYRVIGDKSSHASQDVYCDMTNGGWTMLMRYDASSGYMADINFAERSVPSSSGGGLAPTNRVWAPLPDGNDDGHVDLLAFNLTGGRKLKGVCSQSSTLYSYTTDIIDDWAGGIYGTYQASGTSTNPIGWAVLGGDDIGGGGRSNHYVCGAQAYASGGGVGLCSGTPSSGSWSPHRASVSFWPTSIAIGCNANSGTHFELWMM